LKDLKDRDILSHETMANIEEMPPWVWRVSVMFPSRFYLVSTHTVTAEMTITLYMFVPSIGITTIQQVANFFLG